MNRFKKVLDLDRSRQDPRNRSARAIFISGRIQRSEERKIGTEEGTKAGRESARYQERGAWRDVVVLVSESPSRATEEKEEEEICRAFKRGVSI